MAGLLGSFFCETGRGSATQLVCTVVSTPTPSLPVCTTTSTGFTLEVYLEAILALPVAALFEQLTRLGQVRLNGGVVAVDQVEPQQAKHKIHLLPDSHRLHRRGSRFNSRVYHEGRQSSATFRNFRLSAPAVCSESRDASRANTMFWWRKRSG